MGVLRGWVWEFAAILSSIGCLCAMATLLAYFNNHPVFVFHGVTLNAIIALLSTLSKTTLLFVLGSTIGQWKWILYSRASRPLIDAYIIDEASRGPLGSLWMIWRMRTSLFTALGAICTVLTLAVDPFSQQLIQYQDISVTRQGLRASVPYAQRFSKGLGDFRISNSISSRNITQAAINEPAPHNYTYGKMYTAADASVQSALLSGLTQPKNRIVQQLPFECQYGNCTYPTFQSLAVCSQCIDVADRLEASFDDIPLAPNLGDNGSGTFRRNGTRFTLPNGLYISNSNADQETPSEGILNMVTYGTGNTLRTVASQNIDALIWSLTMIRANNDSSGTFEWPSVPIEALECSLYYCVNEYTATVTNGRINESVTTNATARRSWNSWLLDENAVTAYSWTGNVTASLEYDLIWTRVPRTDLTIGHGFNVSQSAVDSISNHFQNHMADISTSVAYISFLNGYHIGFPGNNMKLQFQPQSIQALYQSDNLTDVFDNIATSLSYAIRAGADNGTTQTGTSTRLETRFNIQWPWFSLHLFLLILAVCDLLATVTISVHERVPSWKSHLLAVIAWGGQLSDPLTGASTTDYMEKLASKETGMLYHDASSEGG